MEPTFLPDSENHRNLVGVIVRRWKSLAAGVLAIFLLSALWLMPARSNPDVTLSFSGFSNYVSSGGTSELHAFFWFTNGARASVWWITSFSRKITNEWVDYGGVGRTIHERIPDSDTFQALDPAYQAQLISFRVDEASLPIRLVILVQERSGGWMGLKERLQQWDYDHWHRRSWYVAGGRRYSVTNEFW